MTFASLPTLPHAQPCAAVSPADIDLSDMEYAVPNSGPAETLRESPAETIARLKAALAPFARAGQAYRQNGDRLHRVVLAAETEDGSVSAVLSVGDFTRAYDVLK